MRRTLHCRRSCTVIQYRQFTEHFTRRHHRQLLSTLRNFQLAICQSETACRVTWWPHLCSDVLRSGSVGHTRWLAYSVTSFARTVGSSNAPMRRQQRRQKLLYSTVCPGFQSAKLIPKRQKPASTSDLYKARSRFKFVQDWRMALHWDSL